MVEGRARVRGRALARRLHASRPRVDVHRALPERALHPQRQCPRSTTRYTTIAELLKDAGYRTFLFSANPHIAADPAGNFAQGFERGGAPLEPAVGASEALRHRAREGSCRKTAAASCRRCSQRRGRAAPRSRRQHQGGRRDRADRHARSGSRRARPSSPSSSSSTTWRRTARTSRPGAFASSCSLPPTWIAPTAWTDPGLACGSTPSACGEYSDDEITLTRATYDATLLELDELLRDLLEALREAGHLDDTIVILTSDHGEQLGEHHMLDHQYSVYQTLLHVPLIVRAPGRLAPGRESRPVMSFDLFPTLLELTGIAAPPGLALPRGEPARSPAGSRALRRGSRRPRRSESTRYCRCTRAGIRVPSSAACAHSWSAITS